MVVLSPQEIDYTSLQAHPAHSLGAQYTVVTMQRGVDAVTIDIPALLEWRLRGSEWLVEPGALCLRGDIAMRLAGIVLQGAERLSADGWPGPPTARGSGDPIRSEALTREQWEARS